MLSVSEDFNITENHVAYVTSKTLLNLNLLNGTWVTICAKNSSRNNSLVEKFNHMIEKTKQFVVKLVMISTDNYLFYERGEHSEEAEALCSVPEYVNNVFYVSTGSLFNIVQRNPHTFSQAQCTLYEVSIVVLEDFDDAELKYYAFDVDVSPVACSFGSISEDLLNRLIKEHFTEPKVLQNDELFAIELNQQYLKVKGCPVLIWFQVKSVTLNEGRASHLQTTAMFANDCHSNLYLSNPINSVIPVCACSVQNNMAIRGLYRNAKFLEAFQNYLHKIESLFDIVFAKRVSARESLLLLEGVRGIGKGLLIRCICFRQCVHFHEENCFDLIGDSLSATEKRLSNVFQLAKSTSPSVLYLKNIHLLGKDKEGLHDERRILFCFTKLLSELTLDAPVMVIGSTSASKDISSRFFSEFIDHVELTPPLEEERFSLLQALGHNFKELPFGLEKAAKISAGFVCADLFSFMNKLFLKSSSKEEDCMSSVETYIEEIRTLKAGSSDTVKIPKVSWEDVGGLQTAKSDIMDTLELPLKFPHLFTNGLQRSGLLFYGPPGCGKTLLAKAIANEFTLNFYSVKGPELINMYVGQSEENVRDVFKNARSMSPCVIFFDEIDSLAPSRGRSGDSGGVMDRIVSQLLAELDGMHDNTDIFVIGATNRPDLLDPSLLRPGRFDKLIYVGVPEGKLERLNILKAVTRKLRLAKEVNLEELVNKCSLNLTGADFYAIAAQATMNCFRRMITQHEQYGTPLNSNDVEVSLEDFGNAIRMVKPSVTVEELRRYQDIREGVTPSGIR